MKEEECNDNKRVSLNTSKEVHSTAFATVDEKGLLFDIVKDNNYFIITTNVDGQFIKAGFN